MTFLMRMKIIVGSEVTVVIECLRENTEKYKIVSVPIAKETESGKTTCKIKSIDSVKFMSSSLSNLTDILSEGLHKDKNQRLQRFSGVCDRDNKLTSECVDCKKNYGKEFDENVAKRFQNTFKFCHEDLHRFCQMLRIDLSILVHK